MNWKLNLKRSVLESLKKKSNGTVDPSMPSKTEAIADVKDEKETIDKKLSEILNISGNEETLIGNIQLHIIAYGNYYANLGNYHGRSGARDFHIIETATTHATLITDRVLSGLSGHIEALRFMSREKNESLQIIKANHKKNENEMQEQISLSMNDSKQFNWVNAAIYVVAGLAMILADIAVSLNLVAFFGIGHPKANSSFFDKVFDLELFFFSMGIALCTIFIKIFYDEYINSKLGFVQLQIRQLVSNGAVENDLKKEIWIKLTVKFIILVGLIWLLYYLAIYRTYFTAFQSEYSTIIRMQAKGQINDIVSVMLKSFIGITVIIPVISGISLSMGLKIFANIAAYKMAERNLKASNENCSLVEAQLQQLTYNLKHLEQYLNEWENKVEKVKLESSFFVQNYNQGFRVSYRNNHGNDLYKLIEEYRNEVINQAFTKHIQQL
ncbi:MAG TPA: hypothetical protein VHB54_16725 [Mucilaginibacter sp.]|nr:hypothetical protein [Mucilaginibacter sp.]